MKKKHITEFGEGMLADSVAHELRKLPHRDWQEDIEGITSIVIIPGLKKDGLHDSGFRTMDFAACHYGTAYCLLSGCSDVIHIGGISGYNNKDWVEEFPENRVKRASWSVDCLPKSGLLQLFASGELTAGCALSSFDIFATDTLAAQIKHVDD